MTANSKQITIAVLLAVVAGVLIGIFCLTWEGKRQNTTAPEYELFHP
jgi:asparagine N-glycosylation enzyme membrane subunit Stt3